MVYYDSNQDKLGLLTAVWQESMVMTGGIFVPRAELLSLPAGTAYVQIELVVRESSGLLQARSFVFAPQPAGTPVAVPGSGWTALPDPAYPATSILHSGSLQISNLSRGWRMGAVRYLNSITVRPGQGEARPSR